MTTAPQPKRRPESGSGFVSERRPGQALPAKPSMPAPYDKADVYAIKALRSGTASSEQQMRALAWIVECAARTYTSSYDELVPSNRDFNEGCRHVGRQITNLINARFEDNDEQGR